MIYFSGVVLFWVCAGFGCGTFFGAEVLGNKYNLSPQACVVGGLSVGLLAPLVFPALLVLGLVWVGRRVPRFLATGCGDLWRFAFPRKARFPKAKVVKR